jgi:hypothetical protein
MSPLLKESAMTPVRILLLVILIGAGAYWYLDKREREQSSQADATIAAMQQAAAKNQLVGGLTQDELLDSGMRSLPSQYRPVASPWEAAEKARYRALLPANSHDVLIVPFQVEGFALDRSTRSLMFAQLSRAVRTTGARVPDPYLVLRALGENRRQFNAGEVHELANHLGVKRIVWTRSGHDRNNQMMLSFRNENPQPNGQFPGQSPDIGERFSRVPFTPELPPILVYQPLLQQILVKLGYGPAAAPMKGATQFDGTLPSSPFAMTTGEPDPARDAFYFLVLAGLTPAGAERTHERFVEKAFLATVDLAGEHPDSRLLRARTLMLMGLRPAALHALGVPVNEEEKVLLGMLNGNLPEVTRATLHVKQQLKRLLAELDLARISVEYGLHDKAKAMAALQRLGLQSEPWNLFASRALADGDYWSQFDNLAFKALLDTEIPVQGFTAQGLVSGATTVADPLKMRASIDFSIYNHVKQATQKEPARFCCAVHAARPTELDYLDLVDAIGFVNLARRVTFLVGTQSRPEDGLAELGNIEAVFKGESYLVNIRAHAEAAAAARAESAAKEGLQRSAYANAFDAFLREQGQTAVAASAFTLMSDLRRNDFGYLQNLYVGDIPFRPSYSTWEQGGNLDAALKNAAAALDNTTIDSQPVFEMNHLLSGVQQKDAEFAEVLKSVEGRFIGNTDLSILRADNNLKLGNIAAAETNYRQAIASQPSSWTPYKALSELLFHEGRIQDSARIAMSFPEFKPGSSAHSVGIANNAYEVGSNYFWSGHFDLAKPLFRISAGLNTGAASGMTSEARLKLMAGDLAGALKATYSRASRYGASYAYRDYLSMLHAMGHPQEAWDGFNTLVGQLPQPHIWESALVGHRISGTPEKQIIEWAGQDALRNAGNQSSYAAKYLLRAAITDRIPGESTAEVIGKFDRPAWKMADAYQQTVKASADGQVQYVLGPDPKTTEGGTLPIGAFDQSQKTRVKSDLEYFAGAYRLLREGKHGDARLLLEEATSFYNLNQNSQAYMLPYFAFAAAKSGNTVGLEKVLAGFRVDQQKFDYMLAKAVVLGVAGKVEDAMPLLRKAAYNRPFTEARPLFTEYEYAEIVELLYESTGNSRYRDLALDWVRKCQVTQPWHAWAYAMEAKLSRGGADRRKAIAMAYYLDRNSMRLKSVPQRQIQDAAREFKSRNPFLNMRDPAEDTPT